MTSTTAVCTAMDIISPPPTCCFAFFLEFRQLSKKYLALLLWTMSTIVPTTTKRAITTTYVCMAAGGTDAESSANGLLVNMEIAQSSFGAVLHATRPAHAALPAQ